MSGLTDADRAALAGLIFDNPERPIGTLTDEQIVSEYTVISESEWSANEQAAAQRAHDQGERFVLVQWSDCLLGFLAWSGGNETSHLPPAEVLLHRYHHVRDHVLPTLPGLVALRDAEPGGSA